MRLTLSAAALAAFVAVPFTARAQETKQQPLILQKERLGSYALIDAARARARKGDCAGALSAFDQAIQINIDPTLRRDRGLCHEKLGDVYPAIEDYRSYLTSVPNAADADDITNRLERLEAQVGEGGPSKREEAHASGMNVEASAGTGPKYDSVRADEDDDSGALRKGKGWILGPLVGARVWTSSSNFNSNAWAEMAGLRLAASIGPSGSFLLEAGFERFNSGSAEGTSISGLTSLLAYEARFWVNDRSVDDHLLLGIGAGYEQLYLTAPPGTGLGNVTLGGLGVRGRFGYRHNLGSKAAIEASLDAGEYKFFLYSGTGPNATTGMVGLNVALLFGL
jgi:hypothetical protein